MVAPERDGCPGADSATELAGDVRRILSPEQLANYVDAKRRYAVGRRLSQLASDVMSKRVTDETITRRLRQLADWFEGHRPAKKPRPVQGKLVDDEQTVFDHWVRLFGKTRAQLTPERRRIIHVQLELATVDDLCRVLDEAARHEFWGGEETRDGEPVAIEGILRKREHVERLLDLADARARRGEPAAQPGVDTEIAELQEQARRATAEGRIDDANEIEGRIRRRLQKRRANP